MDRNQELTEISRALKELSARLDALLNEQCDAEAATECVVEEPAPAPEPVAAKPTLTFALNDRYRFQRELFGNSAAAFSSAVEELAALESAGEVEIWFADRGIDLGGEAAREFFNAIVAQK